VWVGPLVGVHFVLQNQHCFVSVSAQVEAVL